MSQSLFLGKSWKIWGDKTENGFDLTWRHVSLSIKSSVLLKPKTTKV